MLSYAEGDYLEYLTAPSNIKNMTEALIDFEGFLNNVELHEKLDGVKLKSNKYWVEWSI